MAEEIRHITINGRYKVQYERAANAKTDGFKIEVNADSIEEVQKEADALYTWAQNRLAILPQPAAIKKES